MDLSNKKCKACEGGELMSQDDINIMMKNSFMEDWAIVDKHIVRFFLFKGHYKAMSFVNAISWMSQSEGHHAEITIGYNDVTVRYWTHELGGISDNDFICALKVGKIYDEV